uniref:NADH dehydrogenase subunit 6 n=1 Tax=Opamata lipcowa TaxID=2893141 RepID=A0A9E6XT88_9HEMI|nr:NADH dehydrogenase subunit 6 [Opamata lipcowa]UGN61560.1 NADH dehydrogenase subunit 6 [Opamata lipcowa]
MKFMLIKMMMIFSSIVVTMKNPMSMGVTLMMQTMLVIMMMNKTMSTSWFAMITFMMMIGGLLIMFMYMSSIASNEKFKLKMNLTVILILTMIIHEEMLWKNQIDENQGMLNSAAWDLSLMKIYNKKSMSITIMLVLYLLLTMISVTKMVTHHKGPLRAFN